MRYILFFVYNEKKLIFLMISSFFKLDNFFNQIGISATAVYFPSDA